jgi:transcriptional regulator with XRE-family HTH domain
MKIGQVLRRERDRMGYTQVEVARIIGVTGYYVSMVERDKREPSLAFLRRFSNDVCGVPVALLMLSMFEHNDLELDLIKKYWTEDDFEGVVRPVERILYNMFAYPTKNKE